VGTIVINSAGITVGGNTEVVKNLFASKISAKNVSRVSKVNYLDIH